LEHRIAARSQSAAKLGEFNPRSQFNLIEDRFKTRIIAVALALGHAGCHARKTLKRHAPIKQRDLEIIKGAENDLSTLDAALAARLSLIDLANHLKTKKRIEPADTCAASGRTRVFRSMPKIHLKRGLVHAFAGLARGERRECGRLGRIDAHGYTFGSASGASALLVNER
jgi:hypothetical protein